MPEDDYLDELKYAVEHYDGCDMFPMDMDALKMAVEEIQEWRDCVRTSPTMEGPQFLGSNLSSLRRCWERFVLRKAL